MSAPGRALLLQADTGADHFQGVGQRLRAAGLEPVHAMDDDGAAPRLPEGVRVVAVADVLRLESIAAVRAARERGIPTLLLMDGIAEWRNTFDNPSVDERFLRPAPVDLVACAGWIDRAILRSLGNDARASGLPRLAPPASPPPIGDRLLVATARRPAFSEAEHGRVLWSLQRLAHATRRLGVDTTWRVTPRLARELGVPRDEAPLAESLAAARGVITGVSTLLIESMAARRPTAIVHPHDSPLRHPALWIWRASPESPDPAPLIESVMGASEPELAEQDRTLAMLCRGGDAAARVARTILSLASRGEARTTAPMPVFSRPLVPYVKARGGTVRVCVIDGAPSSADDPGERARRAAPRPAGALGARTLVILTDPRAAGLTDADRTPGKHEHVLALDPTSDHTERLRLALDALQRLEPDRVEAGPTDLAGAIATLHAADRGTSPGAPDHALRLHSLSRWNKPWADDPDEARRWITAALEHCGARRVTTPEAARPGDAAIIEGPYLPETHDRVLALRRSGIAAAVCPALTPAPWVVAAIRARAMVRDGARHLAIYGAGAHTRRLRRLFDLDLPFVGVLDDAPRIPSVLGLPVMTPDEALGRHAIDGVLVSSDAHERAMWARAELLRRAGVPVRTIYGADGASWLDEPTPDLRRSA